MEATIETMKAKMAAFESENKELKEYKATNEDKQKTMAVENIIAEFSEKIPKDKLDELREKGKEVENLDAFKNEVKAVAFDYIEENKDKSTINRMGTHVNEVPKVKRFW